MIVNVTPRQFAHVRELAGDGILRDTMERDHTPTGSGTWFDVAAPFIAWEIIMRRLEDTFLTPSLAMTKKTPDAALRLIQHIAKAQNTMLRHPALRDAAMIGVQAGWFPLWITPSGAVQPVPVPDSRFVVLGPRWSMNPNGTKVTVWRPDGIWPRNHWLASEASHTALLGEHR